MIKETHKKIITLIVGIIVSFFGIRTFYLIFIAKEEKIIEKEELTHNNEYELSKEILNDIIYIPGIDGVYKKENTTIDNIDNNLLINYLVYYLKNTVNQDSPPEGFFEFKNENCNDDIECFYVSKEFLNYNYNVMFNKEELSFEEFKNENCKMTDTDLFCYYNKNEEFLKQSVIEGFKESSDYYYIYERAVFLNDVKTEKINDLYNHKISLLRNTSEFNIDTNIIDENIEISTMDEDYASSLITKYNKESYLYKHTFKKSSSNELHYESTEIVNSLNK